MREILFRGKRTDNDEWVEGDLIFSRNTAYIHPKANAFSVNEYGLGKIIRLYEVIPETAGEYTGLCDKNGKKIFEGDVVEFYFFDKTRRNGELVEVKNTKTMLVEWYNASFYMRELYRNFRLDKEMGVITEVIYDYKDERKQGVYLSNNIYFVEIIGNIYDNPELLKGGAE